MRSVHWTCKQQSHQKPRFQFLAVLTKECRHLVVVVRALDHYAVSFQYRLVWHHTWKGTELIFCSSQPICSNAIQKHYTSKYPWIYLHITEIPDVGDNRRQTFLHCRHIAEQMTNMWCTQELIRPQKHLCSSFVTPARTTDLQKLRIRSLNRCSGTDREKCCQ